jgi:hypothetical protein
MRPEVRGLKEQGLQGKRRASFGAELVAEIERRAFAPDHDRAAQPLQAELPFEVSEHALAQARRLGGPVGAPVEVRHGDQGVQRLAARRRQRRVGARGGVEVERQLARHGAALEQVAEHAGIVRRHLDRVVAQLGILPVQAEVQQVAAHGELEPVQRRVGPAAARLGGHQPAVGSQHVGVAHHHVRRPGASIFGRHASGAAGFDQDAPGARAVLQLPTDALEDARQRLDQRVHAAARVVDAGHLLQVRHHGVDAGRPQGVAADEERVEAEQHAQARVAEEARHQAVHRAVGAQRHQVREHREHAAQRAEVVRAQVLEGTAVQARRVRQESVERCRRAWLHRGELRA